MLRGMRHLNALRFLSLLAAVLFLCPVHAQAPRDDTATLLAMLRDPLLWGPDFPSAVRAVPALASTGEPSLQVFRHSVAGGTRYAKHAQAEAAAKAVRGALTNPATPRVPVFGRANPAPLRDLQAIVFRDDRTLRVGTSPDEHAQYLAPDARLDAIEAKYGKADDVTTETLDDGTERRLIGLTLYYYAGGAIVLVTADYGDPRRVDRVHLDTRAVARAAF